MATIASESLAHSAWEPAPSTSQLEHELPLSGCRLVVTERPDGVRVGTLFGSSGQWLDEARCELVSQVSGWFGRRGPAGTSWALAFGAGGSHEALDICFASMRGRRTVQVLGDQHGLWVAEVAGSFRVATVSSGTRAGTLRLRYAALS